MKKKSCNLSNLFVDSNQHFDRNIDKSTNFSVDLLNAGAGSQFNFGNNTQFNETREYLTFFTFL